MPRTTGLLEALTERFLAQRERFADEMLGRIREEVREYEGFDGPELWEAVRASCSANIGEGLESMLPDRELPPAIPAEARDLARLCARLDLPLAALLRSYRVGHALIWEAWFAAVEREPADPATRRATLDAASRHMFAYVDRLSGFVTEEYTAERDRFVRSREQHRTQLVRDILDGADPDPAAAMAVLGYDLRLHHLACLVGSEDPEAALRSLAAAYDAPHSLLVALSGDTAWAWLGRVRGFSPLERIAAPEGAIVSLGDPSLGVEGFRRSHRQARAAHRVALRSIARRTPPAAVRYDEVALEALICDDEARLREFVARELAGIDGDDARSRRLRETLRAYFSTAQNASAAAAVLGVHEHTVTYRLRTIEERLGRPVTSRRAELEVALRLLRE